MPKLLFKYSIPQRVAYDHLHAVQPHRHYQGDLLICHPNISSTKIRLTPNPVFPWGVVEGCIRQVGGGGAPAKWGARCAPAVFGGEGYTCKVGAGLHLQGGGGRGVHPHCLGARGTPARWGRGCTCRMGGEAGVHPQSRIKNFARCQIDKIQN